MRTFRKLFACCYLKEDFYTWDRAPEPDDVYWENLSVGYWNRLCRTLFSLFVTLIISLVCFFVIAYLVREQKERGGSLALSIGISIVITIINSLLRAVVRALTSFQKKQTLTEFNVSVAYKLTVARFFNSAILLIFANWDAKEWFDPGGLVYTASVNIVVMTIQLPL